jgi:hypothetical protein
MHKAIALRVTCPTCGQWAQLRMIDRAEDRPTVISFSCRDQVERSHPIPSSAQLTALLVGD